MSIILNGTTGITSPNDTTGNQSYTGTLTGGTGVVNLGSGQFYKDASGNVGIGVTPAGTGGCLQLKSGITFPATQSASSDANTLDDYEKGTWTPVITSQGGSITSYTAVGIYTKIGKVVTVQCSIVLNTVGTASGYAIVNGYPFANSSNGSAQGVCRENNAGLIVYSVLTNGTSAGYVIGSVAAAITWTNGYYYFFNMTYHTA